MKLSILLGSGASIPAGYPCVTQITEEILSGTIGSTGGATVASVGSSEEVVAFLRWLRTVADARYCRGIKRTTNYEDIYFLASQIRDDLLDEFDNPAVRPLVGKVIVEFLFQQNGWLPHLKNLLERLLVETGHPGRDCLPDFENPLRRLAENATNYIRGRVEALLKMPPKRQDHLDFVAEAIQAVGVAEKALMTVNHDVLLETCLSTRNISFTDGFSHKANRVGIREWDPALFCAPNMLFPLLKLHGGVDWYRFEPDGAKSWTEEYVGIRTREFSSGQKDEEDRSHRMVEGNLPMFLIGTFNKLSSYTDPVYLEIYHHAFRALAQTDALLVVGYGFGDKGINKLVTDWIYRSGNRRLVVVDKYADSLWQKARGSISGKWHELIAAKKLVPLQCDLQKQKLTWREIASAFSSG